jgi:hypothetical protein
MIVFIVTPLAIGLEHYRNQILSIPYTSTPLSLHGTRPIFILCKDVASHSLELGQQLHDYGYYPILVEDRPMLSQTFPIHKVNVDKSILKREGYTHLNKSALNLVTCSWCAAMWLAQKTEVSCWFIEDDVFFCNPSVLDQVDIKYPHSDLICAANSPIDDGWYHSNEYKKSPFKDGRCSMMCAARMSAKLLHKVKEFATDHGRLWFLEYFFNSICLAHNLQVDTPPELSTVTYNDKHNHDSVQSNQMNIFHPVKDPDLHKSYRDNSCT